MALLLLLAGCVLDRSDWFRERDAALCELYVQCFGTFGDEEACEDDLAATGSTDCDDFSAGAAQDCVAALRDQADDCPATDVAAWRIPAICADVCASADASLARTLPTPVPSGGFP